MGVFWLVVSCWPVPSLGGVVTQGTGVFINDRGDVLTARHVVAGCAALFVVKDKRVVRATVAAQDESDDLAVLRTPLKPWLSAVLAAPGTARPRGGPVFAEGYDALQTMQDRRRTVSNAIMMPSAGGLSILSAVRPGASGAAVLGDGGLLLGVVLARTASGVSMPIPLSRSRVPEPRGLVISVRAAPADQIKTFLDRHGVPVRESALAQLGPSQARAPRAATLSVGVICEQ